MTHPVLLPRMAARAARLLVTALAAAAAPRAAHALDNGLAARPVPLVQLFRQSPAPRTAQCCPLPARAVHVVTIADTCSARGADRSVLNSNPARRADHTSDGLAVFACPPRMPASCAPVSNCQGVCACNARTCGTGSLEQLQLALRGNNAAGHSLAAHARHRVSARGTSSKAPSTTPQCAARSTQWCGLNLLLQSLCRPCLDADARRCARRSSRGRCPARAERPCRYWTSATHVRASTTVRMCACAGARPLSSCGTGR